MRWIEEPGDNFRTRITNEKEMRVVRERRKIFSVRDARFNVLKDRIRVHRNDGKSRKGENRFERMRVCDLVRER